MSGSNPAHHTSMPGKHKGPEVTLISELIEAQEKRKAQDEKRNSRPGDAQPPVTPNLEPSEQYPSDDSDVSASHEKLLLDSLESKHRQCDEQVTAYPTKQNERSIKDEPESSASRRRLQGFIAKHSYCDERMALHETRIAKLEAENAQLKMLQDPDIDMTLLREFPFELQDPIPIHDDSMSVPETLALMMNTLITLDKRSEFQLRATDTMNKQLKRGRERLRVEEGRYSEAAKKLDETQKELDREKKRNEALQASRSPEDSTRQETILQDIHSAVTTLSDAQKAINVEKEELRAENEELKGEIVGLKELVMGTEERNVEMEKDLERKERLLKEKDRELERKDLALKKKDRELKEKDTSLKEKEHELEDFRKKMAKATQERLECESEWRDKLIHEQEAIVLEMCREACL